MPDWKTLLVMALFGAGGYFLVSFLYDRIRRPSDPMMPAGRLAHLAESVLGVRGGAGRQELEAALRRDEVALDPERTAGWEYTDRLYAAQHLEQARRAFDYLTRGR